MQSRVDQVARNEDKKVRFVQVNKGVHGVGGMSRKSGLQWRSVNDECKNEEHQTSCSDVTIDTCQQQQQQQQQLHEHAETGQQVTQSLQVSAAATAYGRSVTGASCAGVAATSQYSAVTSTFTDLTTVTSWSGGQTSQTTSAWACPADLKLTTGPCEAASVAQQVLYRHDVASQQQSDDRLMFEEGLTHLKNLYECQLAASRSGGCDVRLFY